LTHSIQLLKHVDW